MYPASMFSSSNLDLFSDSSCIIQINGLQVEHSFSPYILTTAKLPLPSVCIYVYTFLSYNENNAIFSF